MPAPAGERFPCFNGLRAIAAIAVVFHHASIATTYSLRGPRVPLSAGGHLGEYFAHMDAGVQVFFLISGFLLYRPFVSAALRDRPPGDVRRYFRRRFLRIYPAYWVAFIGIAVFIGIDMPIRGPRSMAEYFWLVHVYDPTSVVTASGQHVWRALGGISQSWTLVVEISFYLFLPLYAAALRRVGSASDVRRRLRIELVGLGVLYAISLVWRAFVFWGVPKQSSFAFLGQYWLPAHLDLFAMGMGLAVLSVWANGRDLSRASPALHAIGRVDWLWWVLAAVTFHIVCFYIGLTGRLVLVTGVQAYLRQFLYGLTALFLLLPAVLGPQDRGVSRRVLRWAPIAYLGTISYGIYLWHQAFIRKIHQWGGWDKLPLPYGPFLPHVLGALAITIVVATLSWFLVERPIMRRGEPRRARGEIESSPAP